LIKLNKEETSKDLVFLSVTGKSINYHNFSKDVWKKVVNPIKLDTTPYCCRDTFITDQIIKGVNPVLIGKWVDTSTDMIEKHYFDSLTFSSVTPL
jgi:hypothetical protein